MYCSFCGKPMEAGQNFCAYCGKSVVESPAPQAEELTLFGAYRKFWRNYANFQGRARRKEYWYVYVVTLILSVIASFAAFIPFVVSTFSEGEPSEWSLVVLIAVSGLLLLYSLAVFIPTLALTVRRLHDTGRSGAWYLISLVPYVGSFVLFIFTVLDGQPGANQYGPNPKGGN